MVTPKNTKDSNRDGIVLTIAEENEFLNPNDLSPILKAKQSDDYEMSILSHDPLHNIEEEDSEEMGGSRDYNKRKRDSFDNLSLISTDSMAAPVFGSAKKPKLIRTGSITRGLRRSMSFVATKNPISNILRSRRNSVDPNASTSSVTSIESTFNESIKKPVKEKMRSLRDRIMKSTKREISITPKSAKLTPSGSMSIMRKLRAKVRSPETAISEIDMTDFKTPLTPSQNDPIKRSIISSISGSTCSKDSVNVSSTPIRNSCIITSTATVSDSNNTIAATTTIMIDPDHKKMCAVADQEAVLIFLIFF